MSLPQNLKLAYSQPGFVTFKVDPEKNLPERFTLPVTLARTYGWSLGKVAGEDTESMISELLSHESFKAKLSTAKHVHVYQRERMLPGGKGWEPGVTALAELVGDQLAASLKETHPDLAINRMAQTDELILDVVLVEPGVWWFGYHYALSQAMRWVGGVPKLDTEKEVASRAYFKLQEALLWAGVKIQPGDTVAEIGSAPGGACQLLLELGAKVIAVDPAEMEPVIEKHENLTYHRARGREVKKKEFRKVKWLLADLSIAPNYTIDTITDIVTHQSVDLKGVFLTLKLSDWKMVADIPVLMKRVKELGFQVVRCRQLAFNRQEFCLFAAKDKFAIRSGKRGSAKTT